MSDLSYAYTRANAILSSGLPANSKLVLLCISQHMNRDRLYSWPSVARIAAQASLSPRTVGRVISVLAKQGILAIDRGGFAKSNTYRIVWQALNECPLSV